MTFKLVRLLTAAVVTPGIAMSAAQDNEQFENRYVMLREAEINPQLKEHNVCTEELALMTKIQKKQLRADAKAKASVVAEAEAVQDPAQQVPAPAQQVPAEEEEEEAEEDQ